MQPIPPHPTAGLSVQKAEVSSRIEMLRGSFSQLRQSTALHTALGLLLSLGNALNAGSGRAGAAGFKLDSTMTQICGMRTNGGGGGSLISFLARHAERHSPGALASIGKEAAALAEAAKASDPDEIQAATPVPPRSSNQAEIEQIKDLTSSHLISSDLI